VKADPPEVAEAKARAEEALKQMMGSFEALKDAAEHRAREYTPSHLARDAWESAKDKGADLAEDAVDAVRSRPLATTGVVAAIALFLAREPLMDLASKLAGGVKSKRPARKPKRTKVTQTEAAE
jgi:ElaB/YqjD/DUF883 family membrane-anchored ribosome-binding protein